MTRPPWRTRPPRSSDSPDCFRRLPRTTGLWGQLTISQSQRVRLDSKPPAIARRQLSSFCPVEGLCPAIRPPPTSPGLQLAGPGRYRPVTIRQFGFLGLSILPTVQKVVAGLCGGQSANGANSPFRMMFDRIGRRSQREHRALQHDSNSSHHDIPRCANPLSSITYLTFSHNQWRPDSCDSQRTVRTACNGCFFIRPSRRNWKSWKLGFSLQTRVWPPGNHRHDQSETSGPVV
jgi:hypothetical protein